MRFEVNNEPLRDVLKDVKAAVEDLPRELEGIDDAVTSFTADETDVALEEAGPEEIHERFEVGKPASLALSNISGRVAVSGDETNEIRIHARKYGNPGAMQRTHVEIRKDGNRVEVQTRAHRAGGLLRGNVCAVDYEVTVPKDCQVAVKTVSADILASNLEARPMIQTVSGSLRLEKITADTTINSVSGDVVLEGLKGELILRTTSGDAKISSSDLPGFTLNSVSGDFNIETALHPGRHYRARTVSGDMRLTVPPDTSATLQLKSLSGRSVVEDLPAEVIKAGPRRWQGRIGDGAAGVEMNSISGDLYLSSSASSGSWPAVSPGAENSERAEPHSPGKESDREGETLAVLDALERGEIDVDDAMRKLERFR